MSPADIDPSLRAAEPLLESLDDGFSPPPQEQTPRAAQEQGAPEQPERALGPKSLF
jgi:hypothetical protein